MMIRYFPFLFVFVLALAACGGSEQAPGELADELPLDPQKPTFAFFYTRN